MRVLQLALDFFSLFSFSSYFSTLTTVVLAAVEIRRRKVAKAKEVSAVMDGADWCQMFTERYRPDAVRILDFPHAAEHINDLLEALEKAEKRFPPQVLDRCLHILKHRGPRPLLRIADRLQRCPEGWSHKDALLLSFIREADGSIFPGTAVGSNLAESKGVHEHLDYLRKRESLMQYPQFRRDGWPIGSGMVESAQKNVVEARLKGTGMHWERKNVNPMLALRNAICNDRWKEMWRKAVLQHRKLQALPRSIRAEQRAQALLAGSNASSQESRPQSVATSRPLSPPALFQPTSETAPVTSPPPAPEASQPHSPRPSTRRKRLIHRKRVNSSSQRSAICPCGTPLVLLQGRRTRESCSDRCRQRAYRERQGHIQQSSPPGTATTLPDASRPFAHHQRKRGTRCNTKQVNSSPQGAGGVKGETCLCGTLLVQSMGGRMRESCSDRCRQRAYRQRQRLVS